MEPDDASWRALDAVVRMHASQRALQHIAQYLLDSLNGPLEGMRPALSPEAVREELRRFRSDNLVLAPGLVPAQSEGRAHAAYRAEIDAVCRDLERRLTRAQGGRL